VSDQAAPVAEPQLAARLHPLTPFARGWAAMVAATVVIGQGAVRDVDLLHLGLIMLAVTAAGLVFGLWSWWFTRYVVDGDDLRVDSGMLFRRSRHIRLSRLQAIDLVQPLVARLLGLAELRLEVAGGGAAEGRLAYLSEDKAAALRAELLARAAGVRPDAPEAPEDVLVRVPVSAVLTSLLLTIWVPLVVLGGAGLVMFGMVAATGARILTNVDFKNNRYNLFVVAIAVGFGLIPLAAPNFFRNLPHDLQPLLESGILLCALVAVVLNAFFNGIGGAANAEADAAAVASSAQHV
jgi:membrane protein YdbS with pleckstrin-like domain